MNLELKPSFGLHVPIAAKPNAFCTYIMGGLRDIVTFIRLIIYRCTNMGVQCMQCVQRQRTNAFRPTRCFARNRKHVYIILLRIGQRDGNQCIRCSSLPRKRTLFSHNKRTAAKHATSTKTKDASLNLSQRETLLPCRRKIP